MIKFKSTGSWLLGLIIAKLKKSPIIIKLISYIRLTFPRIWALVVKKLKPFYWRYQVSSLRVSQEEFYMDKSVFDEDKWKEKQVSRHKYNANIIVNGIGNYRPVVDAAVLLERLNRTACRHE